MAQQTCTMYFCNASKDSSRWICVYILPFFQVRVNLTCLSRVQFSSWCNCMLNFRLQAAGETMEILWKIQKYTHSLTICCRLMGHSHLDGWRTVRFLRKFIEVITYLYFFIFHIKPNKDFDLSVQTLRIILKCSYLECTFCIIFSSLFH